MTSYTVSDLVAELLEACDVRVAFGIASVHNIPMLDAIGRRGAVRFVTPRSEAGAAHMADSYARVAGNFGVVISSTGPGAANTMPGLVEAMFAASPVLHITGQTATAHLDRDQGTTHNFLGQFDMLQSGSKRAYRIETPAQAAGILVAAIQNAMAIPSGPVSVEIPIDVQRATIQRPAGFPGRLRPGQTPVASIDDELEALASYVRTARRPLLWLGSGARHARAPVLELLEMGFGLVTSWHGRGVVSEHDGRVLGAYNTGINTGPKAALADCDLLVVAGSRIRGQQTRDLKDVLPRPLVQIDIDPLANGRTYPCDLFINGDSAQVLSRLVEALGPADHIDKSWHAAIAKARGAGQAEYMQSLGVYAPFPSALRSALPSDAILVRDTTWHSLWAQYAFPVENVGETIYPVTGAIGSGLQLAIGAALAADGRKTVLLSGDGGFFMHHGELWTALAEGADLLVIVMNDERYRLIEHVQDAVAGGRHFYSELKNPKLEGVAALAGIPFWKVSEPGAFEPAVRQAVRTEGLRLIEVDMTAIGPAPSNYVVPPYVKTKTEL